MSNLTDLTIAAMRDGLRAKSFSASELTEQHIAAVEAARVLNAFIVETPDHARAGAAAADAAFAKGSAKPLSGIPLGIKDLFATQG
ncbi:MAG: amidase family protein, partial [Polymorphobacter sp.]